MKKAVEAAGKHSLEEVCESAMLCDEYDFIGSSFTEELWGAGRIRVPHLGPFDPDSIM
jgi:hypothetical protein